MAIDSGSLELSLIVMMILTVAVLGGVLGLLSALFPANNPSSGRPNAGPPHTAERAGAAAEEQAAEPGWGAPRSTPVRR
jgi:hypothetical protein